ncbi:MAG: ATP-binding protein [Gammaproteobacteria bacterium]|nr:ATP-binding protein [Gammaproteobacteria bacterium]
MTFSNDDIRGLVGGDILGLVTRGMYTDPLVIYREYIQNAADAIATSNKPESGSIEIEIDPSELCLKIRDNGPGLSPSQAKRELIPLAMSQKDLKCNRGFRGVGRLSGLAFGSSVTFLTRCGAESTIMRVVWNGEQLRKSIDKNLSIRKAILECVTVDQLKGDNYPENFFEVQVEGISRYAASSILNRDIVRDYIGEICPVQFKETFPYLDDLSHLFKGYPKPLTLSIYLNGEKEKITRPYDNVVRLPNDQQDRYVSFEKIMVPTLDNNGFAAIGWVAHSSYLGALSKKSKEKCLRARIGNIQIGDATIFDHLFSESRFNRWCVAEIHILDTRIVPNGKRDYFEPSPHVRNLENHLGAVCRKLERQCRIASGVRNHFRRTQAFLKDLEEFYDLLSSGYLSTKVARQLAKERMVEICDFRKTERCQKMCAEDIKRLNLLVDKFSHIKVRQKQSAFRGIDSSEISTYKNIFKIISEISSSPQAAKKIIESILVNAK